MKVDDVVAKLDARIDSHVEEITKGFLETIDQLTMRVRVLEEYVRFIQTNVYGTAQALAAMENQMYGGGVDEGEDVVEDRSDPNVNEYSVPAVQHH